MADPKSPFWLGGAAASIAASITHPLDLTKVRMQTVPISSSSTAANPTMFRTLAYTVSTTGVRSLFTGLSASIMRQMSYSLVRIGSYESIKRRLTQGLDGPPPTSRLVLAAALAGGLGGIAGNPADILLVRMTTDSLRPPDRQRRYRNAVDGLIRLVREEGVGALAKGAGANTTRAILMGASQLASYDYFKHLFGSPRFGLKDGLGLHVISSLGSGFVATTICAPADVLKSRVMATSNSSSSTLDVLKNILRTEGPKFLFKGWTPAFVRLAPNTVLLFVFLEQFKKLWAKHANASR
ncbi:hypothetical protein BOTBODRAFT_26464 [Botryobasidium botryosum FD-172 SS1]|uniref:Mitochondrial carrier n=1 Tax=Botryobasidium botryosum (strain FD-172 SS1) TaxID=930990 RepID=A0A067N8K7_BOTB1|nr:hypothetical protein BOTBODRAFT_26464 [Botryobasidium botryosum FD-172 SS1]